MDKRFSTALLVLLFAVTSSTYALSLVDVRSNLKEYGYCEVGEVRKGGSISNVSIICKSTPNEKERQGWVHISVSNDETILIFKPTEPVTNTEDSTQFGYTVEQINETTSVVKPTEPTEDSVIVRYRVDEEEFKEESFKFRHHYFYHYADKKIDRDELSDWIKAIETATSIEFDLDGKETTVSKITIEESEEAVKDFRERISLLDQQRDTHEKLSE